MAVQPPFRSDAYQVENSDSPVGPRLIESRLTDGSLLFTDPRVPLGIALYELAGLQRAHNTLVVSQTGEAASKDLDGNPVTTIQKAFDLVPDSADENNLWLILVLPGVYVEDLVLVKDYVTVKALGPVVLQPATDESTLRVVQGLFTTPRKATLEGLVIRNGNVGRSCVLVSTARFAFGTITFAGQPSVGDKVTLAGVVFSAVLMGTVPAAFEFEIGVDAIASAANLAVAVADPVNGLVGTIFPTSALNVTTFRAQNPGIAGNAVTLVSTVPLVMVPSGATFTGGLDASSGSFIGSVGIRLENCELQFTAITGFTFRAQAVNHLAIRGGSFSGSSLGAITDVRECASFEMASVTGANLFDLHYDTLAASLPAIPTSEYSLDEVVGSNLSSNLDGLGSLDVKNSTLGDVFIAGTQSFRFESSNLGAFQAFDFSVAVLSRTVRQVLIGSATATLAETVSYGSLSFVAETTKSFVFPVPQPDLNYQVTPEPVAPEYVMVDNKSVTGFDLVFSNPQTVTVPFQVCRQV